MPAPPLVTLGPGAADLYADLFAAEGGEGGTLLKTQVAELTDRVGRQEAQIAGLQEQVAALTQQVCRAAGRWFGVQAGRCSCDARSWAWEGWVSPQALASLWPVHLPLLKWSPNSLPPLSLPPSHWPGPHACLQNGELSEQASTLTANISALYNTAKLEMQRKDAEIKELRER